jgi:hypothetical protein
LRQQVGGHRFAGAAAEIEDRAAVRRQRQEAIERCLFEELGLAAAIADPVERAALIEIDDRVRTHDPLSAAPDASRRQGV